MSMQSESSSIGPPGGDDGIDRLSRMARRLADGSHADPRAAARWSRLLDQRARLARRRTAVVTAMVLLVVIVAGGRLLRGRGVDVAYIIQGRAAVGEGGYVHDVGDAGARLQFSEGTVVELAAGARAWVVSRDARGARLRLEDGRAHFEVVHRPQARWSVDAGPFAIEVTGTSFDVRWNGAAEELVIALARGSVAVRGPLAGTGVTLRPGQRLVASLGRRALRVEDADAVATPERAEDDQPAPREPATVDDADAMLFQDGTAAVPSPPRGSHTVRTRVNRDKPPQPSTAVPVVDAASWPRRVADRDFASVLAEAERQGVDECLVSCSVEALAALADAARYTGRRDLARRLLLAMRERFPGSAQAHAAAFMLGRMADGAAAVDWYDRYLVESPEGVYAAEALGRKMMAIERLGDRARARRIAAEYRNRFPAGAYLSQATALLQHP